jgi:zinc transport system substrate-binding protein
VKSHNAIVAVLALLFAHATAAAADAPTVVATIRPIHSLTAQVMEGVGVPTLLIEGTADPHEYAFRPSDAKALAAARLVVMIDPEFEIFLEKPLKTLARSARVLALARVDGMALATDEMGLLDRHLWLDPVNAALAVEAIGRALSEVDRAHAYEYTRNAARAKDRLLALDRELRAELAPVRDVPFIVYHDAFRALVARYGLKMNGAIVSGAEHAPRARSLGFLATRAAQEPPRCIFAPPHAEPAYVGTLAQASGARVAELDDLGAAIPAGPDMYVTLMRGVVASLKGCLG